MLHVKTLDLPVHCSVFSVKCVSAAERPCRMCIMIYHDQCLFPQIAAQQLARSILIVFVHVHHLVCQYRIHIGFIPFGGHPRSSTVFT